MRERKRLITIVLAGALTAGIACGPRSENDETEEDTGPEISFSMPRLARWASANANVRAAAGTESEVVATLARGERVEVGGLENGWHEVFRDDERLGYVSQSVLLGAPLPRNAFELRNIAFEVVDRGATAWRYSWTLDLENTGIEPLSELGALINFIDSNRYLVGADTARGISLAPGQRRAFRGEAAFDLPRGAGVRTVTAEITRPESEQE